MFAPLVRGLRRLPVSPKQFYYPAWNTLTSRYPVGTNVYERDWDVLVILDACRVDALREVAPEYGFLSEVNAETSVGSYTAEWMLKTFNKSHIDEISNTCYVSGTAWSYRVLCEQIHKYAGIEEAKDSVRAEQFDNLVPVKGSYGFIYSGWPNWQTVDAENFDFIDHVWYHSAENPETRLHPDAPHIPAIVTDRAISVGRTRDFDRLIVHYTLPHAPFIGQATEGRPLLPHEGQRYPDAVRSGEATKTELYDVYLSSVRLVLEHVGTLLRNLDAETVVLSADHGEALGEYDMYKHPYGIPHPKVKRVPWAKTTATDTGTVQSKHDPVRSSDIVETDVDKNLRALGYVGG